MTTRRIAGHMFDDRGICTNTKADQNECGRHLVDILGVAEEDVGKEGIACKGPLYRAELIEIRQYRDKIWKAHHGSPAEVTA